MSAPNSQIGLSYYTWPLIVTTMLLSVVCAGIYTIILASRTPAQLVENSPYEKGLHFEKTLIERKRAQQQKLIFKHRIFQDSQGDTLFEVQLNADKLASSGTPQKIIAVFMRPSSEELDFNIVLAPTARDSYSAKIPDVSSGLWHIEVRVTNGTGEVSSYRYQSLVPNFK